MRQAQTTDNLHLPRSARWLVLAGVVLVGCVALVARLRNGNGYHLSPAPTIEFEPVPDIRAPVATVVTTAPTTPKTRTAKKSAVSPLKRDILLVQGALKRALAPTWVRWLLFVVAFAASFVLLISLQPPYSTLVMVVIIGAVATGTALNAGRSGYVTLMNQWRSSVLFRLMDRFRAALSFVFTVSGITLLIASAFTFRPAIPYFMVREALLLMILGGLMIGMAIGLVTPLPNRIALPVPPEMVKRFTRLRLRNKLTVGMGVLVLFVLAEINGKVLHIEALDSVTTNVQLWMLVLGVALVIIGMGAIPLRMPKIERRTLLIGGGLTLLALFLRFWHLHDSIRFFVDELAFTDAIREIWWRNTVEILQPMESIAAFPNLFAYLQTQSIVVFGRNFVGLRGASAVFGALAIPALYLLARTLFDKKTALMAAVLLATFPPHLQFSRIGISEMAGPLFGILALAFLGRGVLYNRRADYAVGGAMLGMTHYFHEGSRVFFTPLAALWVVALVVLYRPRVQPRNLLVAVIAAVLVALPIYYTLLGMGRSLAARMVDNNSALSGAYWRQIFEGSNLQIHLQYHVLSSFLIYMHLVEYTLFYKGQTALILSSVVPAFFLGLFQSIWRWRIPGLMLILLWVVSASLGNSLMVDSIGSPRYVMVFPALMLMAAAGIRYTIPLLLPDKSKITWVVIGALTIALAAIQANYYFNEHLPIYNQQFRDNWPHPDGQDAAIRSLDFPPGTQVHIISEIPPDLYFTRGVLAFMTYDLGLDTVATKDFTTKYIASLQRGIDHAFYIEPKDRRTLERLQQYYYLMPPEQSPYDLPLDKQFRLYYAPYIAGRSDILLDEAVRRSATRLLRPYPKR